MLFAVKKVGKPVEVVDLPNEYETLKDAVGGYIEAVYLEHGVILWVNEEGKLQNLPHNFSINSQSIEGDVIFTGSTPCGDNKALTKTQVVYIRSLFSKKGTAYQQYIDRFFEEKDLPLEVWTYADMRFSMIRQIDSRTVVAFLRNAPSEQIQKQIKNKLLEIDFKNGDVMDFLHYMADFMNQHNL